MPAVDIKGSYHRAHEGFLKAANDFSPFYKDDADLMRWSSESSELRQMCVASVLRLSDQLRSLAL